MRRVPLIIAGLFLFISASAQQYDYRTPTINGETLQGFVEKEFRSHFTGLLDTLGIHGVCWVKLKVAAKGGLKKFDCSPGLPEVLGRFIINTIKKTDTCWQPKQVNGKNVESEYLLFPIQFMLQKNGRAVPILVQTEELQLFLSDELDEKPEPVTVLRKTIYVSPYYRRSPTTIKAGRIGIKQLYLSSTAISNGCLPYGKFKLSNCSRIDHQFL